MRRLFVLAVALAWAGCNPSSLDGGDLGADLSSVSDLAMALGSLHHVSTSWSVANTAAAGASVCVVEYPQLPCATADVNGYAVVEAPDRQNITLRYTLAGAYPIQQMVATRDHDLDIGNVNIAANGAWDGYFTDLGLTRDPSKGDLVIVLRQVGTDAGGSIGLAGATVTLQPASGTETYTLDDGTPSTAQAQTTGAGHLRIFNVDPGVTEIVVAHPSAGCLAAFGWSGGNDKLGARIDPSVRTVAVGVCQ